MGCAHLAGSRKPIILIGGLGLGYTLRQVLDMLSPYAQVVVSELLSAVVEWNREFLGELNGRSLEDDRVDIKIGDIVELISRSRNRFDAILPPGGGEPHLPLQNESKGGRMRPWRRH
ncbi:MAG: hypothetical protein AABY49_03060 [Planctomycetota bacterium]